MFLGDWAGNKKSVFGSMNRSRINLEFIDILTTDCHFLSFSPTLESPKRRDDKNLLALQRNSDFDSRIPR